MPAGIHPLPFAQHEDFGDAPKRKTGCQSAIDLAAMSNAVYAYYSMRVGNLVNDAVIPDANSPVIVRSGKFSATGRAWIVRKTLDRRNHTGMHPN